MHRESGQPTTDFSKRGISRDWRYSAMPIPIVSCRLQEDSESETTFMLHRFQRTPELHIARFLTASICLSAFAALPLPQFVVQTVGHGIESECPVEEGRETAEEDVVLNVTVRRRLKTARISRHYESAGMPRKSSSTARHISAIVGHQFANGLRAPLRC